MEEVIDFDQWYQKQTIYIEYWAVYDPETGQVKGIYPNDAADSFEHKIKIENELGEAIGEGKILLSNCFIDFESDTLEVIETKTLVRIDDVLHRIIDRKWSNDASADLTISYADKKAVFSLAEKIKSKKRIHYNNDIVMDFYFTAYNDPHELYHKVSIQINELIGADKIVEIDIPQKFSVYSRRIFKNYVIINEDD